MRVRFSLLVSIAFVSLLGACTPKQPTSAPENAATYYPIAMGPEKVMLQLALDEAERARGLMHRDTLPENHGMLFLFENPGPLGFWMKNTRIPLDLGFFDAQGRLLEIHSLYPYDETSVHSRSSEVLIAVEMNRGWYSKNQITPGTRIDLPALIQAVARRGRTAPFLQLP